MRQNAEGSGPAVVVVPVSRLRCASDNRVKMYFPVTTKRGRETEIQREHCCSSVTLRL